MTLLDKAKPTRKETTIRLLVHGPNGVGKSTFAASAPKPIFIATEDGLGNIDAVSFPKVQVWTDALEQLDALASEPHEHRTVVIDSLDFLEPICWAHVCKRGNKKDIEAFGYGKGYVAAFDDWRILVRKLEALSTTMNVILIAHSLRKSVRNPEGDDYEAWQIKLHDRVSAYFKEWAHIVGFASHEVVTTETNGRIKGLATGRRIFRAHPNAGYDSKTRYPMPRPLPLDWSSVEQAVRAGSVSPIERLSKEFADKLVELSDPDVESKARGFIADRGTSVASLSDAISTVDAYIAERKRAAS